MALDGISDSVIIAIIVIWNLFLASSTVLFYYLRDNLTVKFRNVPLTIVGVLSTMMLTDTYFITILKPSTVPCHFVLWAISLCAPTWFLTFFGKYFLLAFSYQHAKSKLKANSNLKFLEDESILEDKNELGLSNDLNYNQSFFGVLKVSKDAELGRNWYHQNRNRWTTQSICVIIIVLLGFHAVVAALTQWLDPKYHALAMPQLNCIQGNGMIPLFITAILYFGVGGPFLVIMLWPAKDAYWLKFELVALVATTGPIITLFLVFTYVEALSNIFYPPVFLFPFHLLTHLSSVMLPIVDVYRNHLKKTPNNFAKFHLMLKDSDQFADFKEFTVSDFTIENPLFYEAYVNFLNNYDSTLMDDKVGQTSEMKKQNRSLLPKILPSKWNPLHSNHDLGGNINQDDVALEQINTNKEAHALPSKDEVALRPMTGNETRELIYLYDKFIAPGSDYQLNLNGITVRQIKMRMAEQDYDPLMLMPALNEVLDSMYRNTYVRFIKFQQF